jgi:hypothetical protein
MRAWGVILLLVICTAAFGQSKRPPRLEPLPEAPPPPAIPGGPVDEPAVNIPAVPQGNQVEELREGGRVVALKVTPPGGKPYFLVDMSGNGSWIRRDALDTGLSVPLWPVYTFD